MPHPDLVFGAEGLVFLVSAFLVVAAVLSFAVAGYAKRQWRDRSRPDRDAEADDGSVRSIDHFIPEIETDAERAEAAESRVEAVREAAHAEAGVPDEDDDNDEPPVDDENVWERELAA